LITDVEEIEEEGNWVKEGMDGLRESIDDNGEVKGSSGYINEDGREEENYDEGVENGEDLINEQEGRLDRNVINERSEGRLNGEGVSEGLNQMKT
ncbi:FIVAR domain-containing protein, partial [Staphylococcus warneri]|uniref:FIVAR domain-containing protein n=1 Tax=Staphylococcus warneri TaxID=1292 RepID=UPI001642D9DF